MKQGDFTVRIWKRVTIRMEHLLKLFSISVRLMTKLTYAWKIIAHAFICTQQFVCHKFKIRCSSLSLNSTVIVHTGFPRALAKVLLWACTSAYHFTSSQVHHVSTDHRKLKNTALECSPLAKFCENRSS